MGSTEYLRITDLRTLTLAGLPMDCIIIRIDTTRNQILIADRISG